MPKRKVDSDEEASFDDDYEEEEEKPKAKKAKSKGKAKPSKRKEVSDDEEEEEAVSSEEEAVSRSKSIKKPRVASKSEASPSIVKKSAEGDKYIDLGKKKRATVREFKGATLIDIREFYGAEGEEKPGKKGISLSLEQWEVLRKNADTIDELCRALKK